MKSDLMKAIDLLDRLWSRHYSLLRTRVGLDHEAAMRSTQEERRFVKRMRKKHKDDNSPLA